MCIAVYVQSKKKNGWIQHTYDEIEFSHPPTPTVSKELFILIYILRWNVENPSGSLSRTTYTTNGGYLYISFEYIRNIPIYIYLYAKYRFENDCMNSFRIIFLVRQEPYNENILRSPLNFFRFQFLLCFIVLSRSL